MQGSRRTPQNWFVLAASGGPCGPPSVAVSVWLVILVAASTGRRRGRPPWWRPSVWLAGVLAGGPCRRVRPPCWRSVRGWCPSVAVVAVFVAAGGLSAVRWSTGPPWSFRGPWRPFLGLASGGPSRPLLAGVLAVSVGSIPPPLAPVAAGVRCWCLRALLRRRWSRWPCRWPSLLVVLVSVSLRRAVARGPCRWPSVLAAVWRCAGRCRCAVPCGPCAVVRPSVLVSAVVGRWPWSVRPCWCAGVRSVAGVRFLPCSVAVAALSGRRWCWCPSLVLASRMGRILGLADWLAVWALPVVAAVAGGACACGGACLVKERRPVAGWRWAVCGAFRGGGVRLPCLWSLLVTLQRRPWAVRLSKDQTPAAAVAALLVVYVTCLRWRRRRRRRWSRPCASRTTYGGRRSVCRRCCILTRQNTGWR